jgi:hypothetical protein
MSEFEELIGKLRAEAGASVGWDDPGLLTAAAEAIARLTRERDEARIEAFRDLAAIFERDTFEGHEMAATIARNAVALSSLPESES